MNKPRENPALIDDESKPASPAASGIGADPVETGARVSDRTNIHDAGSDANDTQDGLTEQEEAVRRAAEDIPSGASPEGPIDRTPVFDRGGLPPRI
jgi:hypothetical protein